MATNFVHPGNILNHVATGNIASGDVIVVDDDNVNGCIAIAITNAATGETVAAEPCGVVRLPKAAGAIAQHARVYWDVSAGQITTTANGNVGFFRAFVAAGAADTTVDVKINR